MKFYFLILLFYFVCCQRLFSQSYTPVIELAVCPIKTDPRLIVKYGYLVVPENRKKVNGRKVKIPFFFARQPNQDDKRNVFLYTTGGPGYSAIDNTDSVGYESGLLKYGGLILFDQRGTKLAKPCLDCMEVPRAIKRSYEEGLNKDSLVLIAIKDCRKRFVSQGIDLSAYNTMESAEDINDLRLALDLDSLNLAGVSYSGGLMLNVLRKHPEAVRTVMLNSPLPSYARYDEDGLLNINEALNQVFTNDEGDTLSNKTSTNLRERFQRYFTDITGKKFQFNYLKRNARDSTRIYYTKGELLDIIVNRLNSDQVETIPAVIEDLIAGKHRSYLTELTDGSFAEDHSVSLGMRYSVYCSEQIAYSDPVLQNLQNTVLPWLAGCSFNDVSRTVCDCWKVKPEPEIIKKQVYSKVPALIVGGDIDPSCRPFYNRLIKRYMPNAQLMFVHNGGHGPGYVVDGVNYATIFFENPHKKIISQSKNLIIE
jgi:pimeloyl-ACP methyl ester carboxylesterase